MIISNLNRHLSNRIIVSQYSYFFFESIEKALTFSIEKCIDQNMFFIFIKDQWKNSNTIKVAFFTRNTLIRMFLKIIFYSSLYSGINFTLVAALR